MVTKGLLQGTIGQFKSLTIKGKLLVKMIH